MALMNPEGAVNIIYRNELKAAADPAALKAKRLEEYNSTFGEFPYHAAAMRWVEEIIDPRDTRPLIIQGLKQISRKKLEHPKKKHGNIPL